MTAKNTNKDAARDAGQLPNYRIYDRTGGGGTHDIYAPDLDTAIEMGREWIEEGDWSSGQYRTITLDCCVREIVRVPDLRSIEALPAVYEVTVEDDVIVAEVDFASLDSVKSALSFARLARISDPDHAGIVRVAVCIDGPIPMMIDEQATVDGYANDCSGTHTDELPACDGDDSEEHDWQQPFDLVGGIRENPGVWSQGGTAMIHKYCCANCGRYKTERTAGSQRNSGEPIEVITLEDADDESLAWAAVGQSITLKFDNGEGGSNYGYFYEDENGETVTVGPSAETSEEWSALNYSREEAIAELAKAGIEAK